jgi:hypothetical protein
MTGLDLFIGVLIVGYALVRTCLHHWQQQRKGRRYDS